MELLETAKPFQTAKHLEMQTELLSFPKVCNADPNMKDIICLQEFMMKNQESIISDIKKQGAVLFRGFDIKSPNQSVAALKHLNFTDFGCYQSKLKIIVGSKDKQMLNTEPLTMFACDSSSDMQHANIHNQFCQTNECPQFVALYCLKPALKGGNISLINWREFSKYVDEKHPDFLQDIKSKGITEITILSENQNLEHTKGNGWKNNFKVANREEAEKLFEQKKYEFQWLNNQTNDCRLKKIKKGAELYNILNQIISLCKNCEYQKNELKNFLTFGDGEKIPQKILDDICQNAQKFVQEIQMSQGDLIVINYEILKYIHCPFEGPSELRKFCVSFTRHQFQKEQCKELYQILNNGNKLPMLGFGTWKIKKQQAEEVVYNAIKCGYRLIDCAPVYQNEKQVGKGINKALKEKIVKREELFITSKLWNTNHRPEHVRPACESTLKNMNLEYLDLFLMHFPISLKYQPIDKQKYPEWIYDEKSQKPFMLQEKVPVPQTWKAMEDLYVAKLVRNIGLSNFPVSLIRQVINTCQIKPQVLQNEIHPQMNLKKLVRYARQEGIQVTSYSSFGASSYFQIGFAKQNDDEPKIGEKHKKSPHQVILRWIVQQGISVIPKSVKPERMKQNSDIIDFSLDKQEMDQIQKLNKNRRFNDPGQFCQGAFGKFYPLYQ